MIKYIVVLIVFTAIFTGCSTVFNTTTQDVEIKSVPSNAKLIIDGKKFGLTPQKVNLERKINHVIKLELDGYEVYETQATTKISNWFWLNIFNGFIPGGVIDMFTGSMYRLLPEDMNIELQPAKVVVPTKKK